MSVGYRSDRDDQPGRPAGESGIGQPPPITMAATTLGVLENIGGVLINHPMR